MPKEEPLAILQLVETTFGEVLRFSRSGHAEGGLQFDVEMVRLTMAVLHVIEESLVLLGARSDGIHSVQTEEAELRVQRVDRLAVVVFGSRFGNDGVCDFL